MHRVFNCGIGMTIVVDAAHADDAVARLRAAGEAAVRIGEIDARPGGGAATVVV
jgi:phosphoribosylformylglycinamidine cyclo-ligase